MLSILQAAQAHLRNARLDEASAVLQSAGGIALKNHMGRTLMGNVRLRQGRLEEALSEYDAAIAMFPGFADAHIMRGQALCDLCHYEEAERALDLAERLGAKTTQLLRGRAAIWPGMGRLAEALSAVDAVLAQDPEDAEAHYGRCLVLLRMGRFGEGWAEYEWRLKQPEFARPDLIDLAPFWRGEDVADKKVLLYSEQGAGDAIQIVRYAPLVAARGARVSMVVHQSLRRLFADSFPEMDVSDDVGERTGFDYQVPLMSLPHVLKTNTEAAIPRDVPYLAADPERVAKWTARLGRDGFKVGIGWQGNAKFSGDRFRSIPLRAFAPLAAVPGVRLISLQALWGLDQLASLPEGMTVETLGEELVNNPDGFREMAAIMANLDLMIVSDSAPAHLAGALGLPVWVALTRYADWRWFAGRSDSPWYPTMRLFRQKTVGDWAGLFGDIAAKLAGEIAARGQK